MTSAEPLKADPLKVAVTGAARNAGSHFQVKLSDNSRGRVEVGDTTLLFQFVVPPPIQPRPQLPAAVVGGFVSGIDWLFTAFVMSSFMTLFGFIIYLENADWPIEPTIAVASLANTFSAWLATQYAADAVRSSANA